MLLFIMKQSRESELQQQQQQRMTANGALGHNELLPVLDHAAMRYSALSNDIEAMSLFGE